MFDFTDPNKREEQYDALTSALEQLAARHRVYVSKSVELEALRQRFDALWTGKPIQRGGNNGANAETRVLTLAMMAAGFDKETKSISGGWDMSYGKGETVFLPFESDDGNITQQLIAHYRAAISALTNAHD